MAEYLDKEAFKKSVEARYCKPCKKEKKDHNGCWCRACWVNDMIDEVECFLPADVAPVVHGRWEKEPSSYWRWTSSGAVAVTRTTYRCGLCGRGTAVKSNYCPSCGAKMDGGDNDEAD